MRRLVLVLLASAAIVGCARVDEAGVDWGDLSAFEAGLIPEARSALDEMPGATVYRMDLDVADDLLHIAGKQAIRYTNREQVALEEIYIRVYPNVTGGSLRISSLAVDGSQVKPAYEYADTAVRVDLPTPLQPGGATTIETEFDLKIGQDAESGYSLFGNLDGYLLLNEFYPVIAVHDDEGWNVEIPSENADLPYYDASFYEVTISAPEGVTLVASGVASMQEEADGRQMAVYRIGPARNFYFSASDSYEVISGREGRTTVNYYAPTEFEEGARLALKFALESLKSFNRRFGVYPYTELDIIAAPLGSLGMEYPGIVAIRLELHDKSAEVSGLPAFQVLEGVVAHEVGHQWFFNAVGSDQIDEPWVDEALTQYVTGLYYLDAYGKGGWNGYRQSWLTRWERVDNADIPVGLPAREYKGKEYGAIVYGRGPLFFEALADQMGQETFDGYLRDYYNSHLWGIGTGEDLRTMAEAHCDCDLAPLFGEWVDAR